MDDVNDNKECISWCYFFNYRKSNFSHLKVSKPSHDICKECYIFFNGNKYVSSATGKAGSDSDWDTDTEEEESNDDNDDKGYDDKEEEEGNNNNNLIMAEG